MSENPFFEKENQKRSSFLSILQSGAIILSVIVILYLFVLTPNQVSGPSMEPTFLDKEIIFVNRLSNWIGESDLGKSLSLDYKRGDVVVFQIPSKSSEEIVKRIIGLPGDKISLRNGRLFINDSQIREDYLPFGLQTEEGDFLQDGGESKVVPLNSYFLLGDNRPKSLDSRISSIGFVRREWIKGKVFLRLLPLNKFGIIRGEEIIFNQNLNE